MTILALQHLNHLAVELAHAVLFALVALVEPVVRRYAGIAALQNVVKPSTRQVKRVTLVDSDSHAS